MRASRAACVQHAEWPARRSSGRGGVGHRRRRARPARRVRRSGGLDGRPAARPVHLLDVFRPIRPVRGLPLAGPRLKHATRPIAVARRVMRVIRREGLPRRRPPAPVSLARARSPLSTAAAEAGGSGGSAGAAGGVRVPARKHPADSPAAPPPASQSREHEQPASPSPRRLPWVVRPQRNRRLRHFRTHRSPPRWPIRPDRRGTVPRPCWSIVTSPTRDSRSEIALPSACTAVA